MKLRWRITLYSILSLGIAIFSIATSFFTNDTLSQIALIFAGLMVIAIYIGSFTFAKTRYFLRVSSKSKAVKSISDMSLRNSDSGLILYDKFNRIISVSDDLKENGIVDVEGTDLVKLFPGIDLSNHDGSRMTSATYTVNKKSYDVKSIPSIKGLILKDQTELEKLYSLSINSRVVIGLIKISNLNIGKTNVLSDYEVSYKVQKVISDWSIKHNAYFYNSNKNVDNDNWLFSMNFENYRDAFLSSKDSLFTELNKVLNNKTDNAVVSIGLGLGSSSVDKNGLMAEEALKVAEESGSNQVVVKEHDKEVSRIEDGQITIAGLNKGNISIFATNLIRKISMAKNVIIIGHNRSDADSLSSSIATCTFASQLNKNVKFYIDKMDDTANKLANDMLDSKMSKLMITSELILRHNIKKDTLVIVLDTTSSLQLPKKVLETHPRENLIIIDHHLLSESSFKTTAENIYLDVRASSTAEILTLIIDVISSRTKRISISKELAMMLLVGILIDTRSLTNGLSHLTFEAVSLLSKWGARMNRASEYSNTPIEAFLDSNLILKHIQVIDKNLIIATADRDYIVKDDISLSISGDRLINVEGIDASFIIAKVAKDKVKVSARGNGRYNITEVVQELGGGGRDNAAAAIVTNKDTLEVKKLLLQIIQRTGN
ncbi:MAG: DHH family phosphoesterase [Mycoplasmataceae bacterium]|nr:DHH family phosphoesterase [Mycoplasmataceae bacterium]